MDLTRLTRDELEQAVESLRQSAQVDNGTVDRIQEILNELQLHRYELEMQNRALREAQSEVEFSIRRHVDLYDSLPIGYLTVDPAGRILEANLTATEWLGTPRERLIGRSFKMFIGEPDRLSVAQHLADCVRSATSQVLEATLESPDRGLMPVQLSSRRALPADSKEVALRIAITDISRLKEVQDALCETNAEQEAFTYSISHDLRAPLVTITNYSEYLATEYAASLEPAARNVLERIQRAAQRMDIVLNNLLLYSRVSRADLELGPVDVGNVITEVLIQHQGLIQESRAEIHLPDEYPTVHASRDLLSQVIGNLLTNAIKYKSKDAHPVITFSFEKTPVATVLCVSDQGIGIDPADHERVFKIFERLHSQGVYPGTGIGLAVVRRAVERMNGRIWIESELGQGSRFKVELPK